MIWNEQTWDRLAEGFTSDYAGYRPQVIEAPDGKTLDTQKRFLHIAPKYGMDAFQTVCFGEAFERARIYAPITLRLDYDSCALRVLEYAPGVGGAGHTDFDFLTVNLWRSHPTLMHCPTAGYGNPVHVGELAELMYERTFAPDYHEVLPHPTETQKAIVFFALPSPDTLLLDGRKVGEWLAERIAGARHYRAGNAIAG